VSVQDAGAQLAAPLLDLQDGMRVLDACAAPGGKSGHILEMADVELTALDADAKRLARVDENLQRLGLQATLQPAPPSAGWWDGKPYDRILADVPCTASGIVRRHPGYPLAAPQERYPPTCNTFHQNTRQPLADAAARW
jgi:16S rRNA (cytosine967-C5)-methyltransferase